MEDTNYKLYIAIAVAIALLVFYFIAKSRSKKGVFVVVAGLCFAGTCIMSIVHNRDSFGDAVLSILGKMFIILFTFWTIAIVAALLILYLLLSLVAHSPRDEYIVLKYDRYLDAFVGYRYYD